MNLFVQLAGTNRPVALAQANAILSRIDLLCEVMCAYRIVLLSNRVALLNLNYKYIFIIFYCAVCYGGTVVIKNVLSFKI